jgi:hypothetical protein
MAVFRPSINQWFVMSPGGGRLLTTLGTWSLGDLPIEAPIAALVRLGAIGKVGGIHLASASASVRTDASLSLSASNEPGAAGPGISGASLRSSSSMPIVPLGRPRLTGFLPVKTRAAWLAAIDSLVGDDGQG